MPDDRKIMEFTSKIKDNNSLKFTSSTLSPGESNPLTKKANLAMEGKVQEHTATTTPQPEIRNQQIPTDQGSEERYSKLKNTTESQNETMTSNIQELEGILTQHKQEVTDKGNLKIDTNKTSINVILEENKHLRQQNINLIERLSKIDQAS